MGSEYTFSSLSTMPSLELIQAFLAPQIILFLLFGVGALATALTMLLHPNPVRAALFLVLNLFCVAVLYLLLNAYFLAAVQVVVYAGAIMVLFLFVIMLLNLGTPDRTKDRLRAQQPFAVLAGLVLAGALGVSIVTATQFPVLDAQGNPPETKKVSKAATKVVPASAAGAPPSTGPNSTGMEDSSDIALDEAAPEPTGLPDMPTAQQGTVAGIGKHLYSPNLPYLFPFEVTSILLLVATIGAVVLAKRKMPGEEPTTAEDLA